MSDWRLGAESSTYKEALRAVESIEPPAIGFVRPREVTEKLSSTQLKQNNTIIQLLIKISENLEDLKTAIKRIEAKETQAKPEDLTLAIDDLQKKLQGLDLGTSKPIKATKGRLYVFKNPQDIFDEEKRKARLK